MPPAYRQTDRPRTLSARSRVGSFLVVVSAVLACGEASASLGEAPSSTGLQMELQLDGATYLQGQPILVLACVKNDGPYSVYDVAPMDPQFGSLYLSLRQLPGGAELRRYGTFMAHAFNGEGLKIAAGDQQCEVFNLLNYFGEWPQREDVLSRALAQFSLPPGEYELASEFAVRTGVRSDLKQMVVKAAPVHFRVLPRQSNAAEERLAKTLTEGQVWSSNYVSDANQRRCREMLPKFMPSAYLVQVFDCALPLLADEEVDSLVASMGGQGINAVRRAAILWRVCARNRLPETARLSWVRSRRTRNVDPVLESVLVSWEGRLAQHKYYQP